MSMCGYFLVAPELRINALLAAPDSEETTQYLLGVTEEPSADLVDVDKAWHAIHFLLTGSDWEGEPPLDFIVRGGFPMGEDLGYGPARVFTVAETEAIGAALARIEPTALAARFDAAAMDRLEIYPSGGWAGLDPTNEEEFGYFSGAYEELRELVLRARRQGLGLITFLG